MPSRPKLNDDQLREVATYLSRDGVDAEIHAEMKAESQQKFEAEYGTASDGYPLPPGTDEEPYYVWRPGANKRGRQLRVYFTPVEPMSDVVRNLTSDRGKRGGPGRWRINHSNLVIQLVECGYILGSNAGNTERIREFSAKRFS